MTIPPGPPPPPPPPPVPRHAVTIGQRWQHREGPWHCTVVSIDGTDVMVENCGGHRSIRPVAVLRAFYRLIT